LTTDALDALGEWVRDPKTQMGNPTTRVIDANMTT
jgi:hypothetical protein